MLASAETYDVAAAWLRARGRGWTSTLRETLHHLANALEKQLKPWCQPGRSAEALKRLRSAQLQLVGNASFPSWQADLQPQSQVWNSISRSNLRLRQSSRKVMKIRVCLATLVMLGAARSNVQWSS